MFVDDVSWVPGIGFDLLTQLGNEDVDVVGRASAVIVPNSVLDLFIGAQQAGIANQVDQQVKLGAGETNQDARNRYLALFLVDGQDVVGITYFLTIAAIGRDPA